ncbi:hypothetical protein PTKIN_Ptkin12aG0029500 [Pterospermum kingtungense]
MISSSAASPNAAPHGSRLSLSPSLLEPVMTISPALCSLSPKIVYPTLLLSPMQNPKKIPLDKAFDLFFEGKTLFGPYWEHVLGIVCEEIGGVYGVPFSLEEEEQGEVEKIVELCSFEHMSNLEVSKVGLWQKNGLGGENKIFFRKGMVGDWKNWLTPEMARQLDKKMEQMLIGSGLTFHIPS